MTNPWAKDEFLADLTRIGFSYESGSFAWRRAADGAAISAEFVDDFIALWPDLAPAAIRLLEDGAKTVRVVSEERDGKLVGRLEVVE